LILYQRQAVCHYDNLIVNLNFPVRFLRGNDFPGQISVNQKDRTKSKKYYGLLTPRLKKPQFPDRQKEPETSHKQECHGNRHRPGV